MHVEVIEDREQFEQLEPEWSRLYAADPEAHFFVSWAWLSGCFRSLSKGWLVLGVKTSKQSKSYVGFCPILKRKRMSKNGNAYSEIAVGGSRFSDYTGFVCLPDLEREVTSAFARTLHAMQWRVLTLDWFCSSEKRTRAFLSRFSGKSYEVRKHEISNKSDGINLCISPYVRLPDTWETYLSEKMSANSRQRARRFLRKLDLRGDLRITLASAETIERDTSILVEFWKAKWASRKGERTDHIVNCFQAMLKHCLAANTLFMPVLWLGSRPLGTLVLLIDEPRKALRFQVSGCDTSVNSPPPGFLLHAYSIRYAISLGYQIYDFLRGNEAYKYSFGSEERRTPCIQIHARHQPSRSAAMAQMLPTQPATSAHAHALLHLSISPLSDGMPGRFTALDWEIRRRKAFPGAD